MVKLTQFFWATAVCVSCVAAAAQGATSAYWRHEGTPGTLIPAGNDTVPDSSGNGNHMQTFDPSFTSATYSSLVSPVRCEAGCQTQARWISAPAAMMPG